MFGSYGEVSFGKLARSGAGPAVIVPDGTVSGSNSLAYDWRLRDYSVSVVGANLIWSPVRDLDIGFEGVYTRADLKNGRVADLTLGSVAQTGLLDSAGNRTIPARTAKSDDIWAFRMRVQRDF